MEVMNEKEIKRAAGTQAARFIKIIADTGI